VTIKPVPDIDWVGHVQALTPPIRAGRFYVHGSHVPEPVPDKCVRILMDAGPAFGTGDHQSTRGCLMALDRLAQGRPMRKILDLGCGSGILSLAAARIWPAEIIAADFDADAVAMTRRFAHANGVAERITAVPSTKAYGRLSVMVQWLCQVKFEFGVDKRAFTPPPKVTSSIVRLDPRADAAKVSPKAVAAVTAAAFGQRRKMLRSSLKKLWPQPETVLAEIGIDPRLRAEQIAVDDFLALAARLEQSGAGSASNTSPTR